MRLAIAFYWPNKQQIKFGYINPATRKSLIGLQFENSLKRYDFSFVYCRLLQTLIIYCHTILLNMNFFGCDKRGSWEPHTNTNRLTIVRWYLFVCLIVIEEVSWTALVDLLATKTQLSLEKWDLRNEKTNIKCAPHLTNLQEKVGWKCDCLWTIVIKMAP